MSAPMMGKKYALATNHATFSRASDSLRNAGVPELDIKYCVMKTARIVFIP